MVAVSQDDTLKSRWLALQAINNYTAVVLVAFGIVYACSLSFAYVEGDDAMSIAFHALGRDTSLQPPYSPYHGMMDVALSVLPASEPVLRITAMAVTSLAATSMVILILSLVFDWLKEVSEARKKIAALVILLASPEFFYFGLLYMPSLVAMCLILGAHLLVRHVVKTGRLSDLGTTRSKLIFALSLILYGLGVACRWDIGSYGLVIVTDIVLGNETQIKSLRIERGRFTFGLIWGAFALASAFAAIAASGYGANDFLSVLNMTQGDVSTGIPTSSLVGALQTLLTPAFLLLGVVGFISIARKRMRLAVIVISGIILILPFLSNQEPKLLIPGIPSMVVCVVEGFSVIWFSTLPNRFRLVTRVIICLLLIGPWLVGIRVDSPDTSWGPGYEVREYSHITRRDAERSIASDYVEQRTVSAKRIALTMGGGFAIPTAEGPRPLGGHAAVLLGGGWRALINELDEERRKTIQQALSMHMPILQDDGNAYIVVHLLQMGFTTQDPKGGKSSPAGFIARQFYNNHDEHVTIIPLQIRPSLFDINQIDKLAATIEGENVILYSGYSSTLRKLFQVAPDAVQSLGPFSAILNISQLRKAVGHS